MSKEPTVSFDLTKFVVLVGMMATGAVLIGIDKLDAAAGIALITTPLGYVFGNGHGVIETKRTVEERVDELARAGVVERRG